MGSKHDDQGSGEHPRGVPSPNNEERKETRKSPAWVNHDPFVNRHSGSSEASTQDRQPATRSTAPSKDRDAASASASSSKVTKAPPQKQRDTPKAPPKKTTPKNDETPLPKVSVDPSLIAPTPSPATPPKTRNAPTSPPQGSDRVSTQAGVDTSPRTPPKEDDPVSLGRGDGRRPRRRLLLPLWIWFLIIILGLASLLLVIDLRTTKRFRLLCQNKHLSVGQARRFPWPFGFETLGGNLRPITVFDESTCNAQYVETQDEAEEAFLNFVLRQVREALANPTLEKLSELQGELEQCRHLAAQEAHAGHAKEVRFLLADIAYRSGRKRLTHIEMTLREALAMFQKARNLGADRYEDLDDWIAYLERLLRQVAPSPKPGVPSSQIAPGSAMTPRAVGKNAPSPTKRPEKPRSPQSTTPPPLGPGHAPPPGDAGSNPPDAGTTGGSGILL